MNLAPSAYQNEYLTVPADEFFLPADKVNQNVEQSAIYEGVKFNCLEEDAKGIVLTSECDLVRASKEHYVILARIAPIKEFWYFWLASKYSLSTEEIEGKIPTKKRISNDAIGRFTKDYLKDRAYAYSFVPALQSKFDDSVITFDVIECISIETLTSKKKLAVLASPFREAVPAKYAAYIGRIGTRPISPDYFQKMMGEICKIKDP